MKGANKIKGSIVNCSFSPPQDLVTLKEDAANKEKKGRNQLNKSGDTVPLDFAEALEDVLMNDLGAREANKFGSFVGPVLKATKREFVASKPPMVYPGTPDSKDKRWTGFPSEAMLLAYVFIIWN